MLSLTELPDNRRVLVNESNIRYVFVDPNTSKTTLMMFNPEQITVAETLDEIMDKVKAAKQH